MVNLVLKLKQLYFNRKIKVPKGKHKANMPVKKRYVTGLNEVCKHLKAGNLTMVIIATDLEKVEEEGGIDEVIATIANTCQKAKVPLVYNLTRTRLGCLAKQKGQSVSAVGVQNF